MYFKKVLKVVKVFTQKYQDIKITFLAVFLTSLFILIINLVNQLMFIGVKILLINLQSSNTRWICEKIIEDEKVRDHCL